MKLIVFALVMLPALVVANGYHGGHGDESGYRTEIKHVWHKHDYGHGGAGDYGHGDYGHGKVLTGHSSRYFKMQHNKGKS